MNWSWNLLVALTFLETVACTVKNAVELLGAFRPDVEKIQYH
jgi:hypothetical protein